MASLKKKNKHKTQAQLLITVGFRKGHVPLLRSHEHLLTASWKLILPAPGDTSNVNHLRLQEMRETRWWGKIFSISVFGVSERPAPDEMLPALCKWRGVKRFSAPTARTFHKPLVLILVWQLQSWFFFFKVQDLETNLRTWPWTWPWTYESSYEPGREPG